MGWASSNTNDCVRQQEVIKLSPSEHHFLISNSHGKVFCNTSQVYLQNIDGSRHKDRTPKKKSWAHVRVLTPIANKQTIPSSLTAGVPRYQERGLPIILSLFCPAAFCLEALPSGGTNPPIPPYYFTPKSPPNTQTTPSFFFCLLSPWLYLAWPAYIQHAMRQMWEAGCEKGWHSPVV